MYIVSVSYKNLLYEMKPAGKCKSYVDLYVKSLRVEYLWERILLILIVVRWNMLGG